MSAAKTISRFFAAWSESDARARNAVFDDTLGPDCIYADPRTEAPVSDRAALLDYLGQYAQMAPGATATVVAQAASHGAHRATVEFKMPDGQRQYGQYFIETDADDRLSRLCGFVGLGAPE